MMPDRSVEDRLREEYFDLLPEVRRVLEHLEAELRYRLLPISRKLLKFERLDVSSRLKECESAVESLRRRQQGAIFYPNPPAPYTLTSLKDLAGVRVLVFPRSRMNEVDAVLRKVKTFREWASDPVRDDDKVLALKYSGFCTDASSRIRGEYQIVSVLTGLFWNIEHAAIYKPSPQLKGVARSLTMQERSKDVMEALSAFEEEFERLVHEGSS
jgi:ppGpp synthetase/RelA/SpoT-type nucleotidyltranferase